MILTLTGHSWTGMMIQTGMTMVGMTAGPGVVDFIQPQRPAASSSTAASSTSFTGAQPGTPLLGTTPGNKCVRTSFNCECNCLRDRWNTDSLCYSRRTGTVTRPVLSLLWWTHLVNLNGYYRFLKLFHLLELPPPILTIMLGRHHENCISPLSPKERCILFDSGPAAHCCPLDYAPDCPLLQVGKNPPRLKTVVSHWISWKKADPAWCIRCYTVYQLLCLWCSCLYCISCAFVTARLLRCTH